VLKGEYRFGVGREKERGGWQAFEERPDWGSTGKESNKEQ
jgi:hypothetical protein